MPLRLTALLLCILGALSAAPAQADDIGTLQLHFGTLTYQFYCVSCHGAGGKGNGPVAAALTRPPADLTQLARQNGGAFPVEKVTAAIDGRIEIVGHLNLAMPPWGQLFAHELEAFPKGTVVEALIARRIAHIIVYLESIQER
ncbi:MAG: c-type cytochrome [Devosia sp.]|nr:c-type cytochrome [Devosia sp.]